MSIGAAGPRPAAASRSSRAGTSATAGDAVAVCVTLAASLSNWQVALVTLVDSANAVAVCVTLAAPLSSWQVALVTLVDRGGDTAAATRDGDVRTVPEHLWDIGAVAARAQAAGGHVSAPCDGVHPVSIHPAHSPVARLKAAVHGQVLPLEHTAASAADTSRQAERMSESFRSSPRS